MLTITCPVKMAARLLECQFVESLFFRISLEAGFGSGSEQRAQELYQTYMRGGYTALPPFTQKFIIKVNQGVVTLKKEVIVSEPRKAS